MSSNTAILEDQKLERQRAYAGTDLDDGTISVADTRPDAAEEKERMRKRKNHDAYMAEAQKFTLLNVELKDYLSNRARELHHEVNAINNVINKLEEDDINHDIIIANLRDYKKDLNAQKAEYKAAEAQRQSAKTSRDLQNVYTDVQNHTQNVNQTAAQWRNDYRTYWANPAAYARGAANAAGAGAGAAGQNNDETAEQKETRQKRALKGFLTKLSKETDNDAIKDEFTFLNHVFGQRLVIESLVELGQDAPDTDKHKYTNMLATFRTITANPGNDPAP